MATGVVYLLTFPDGRQMTLNRVGARTSRRGDGDRTRRVINRIQLATGGSYTYEGFPISFEAWVEPKPPALRRGYEPSKIRIGMPGDVLLICGECGCASDEHAAGWAAFTGEDPGRLEPTSVAIMCPVCASREFEWRPEAAEDYT